MTRLALIALLLAAQEPKEDRTAFAFYHLGEASNDRHELEEMGRTGVDVALVLGGDAERLAALVRALEELEKAGRDRPRLAPAIDPGVLKGVDLYDAIRGFLRSVPPAARATADGRLMVWLLPPGGLTYEKGLAAALNARAKADFDGRGLYLVADVLWTGFAADRTFAWGAAHAGPRELPVVSVGPGCAKPERARDDGKFYERSCYVALRLEPRWVAIESWNGAASGTDVAESKEHKRKYLDATANFLRKFRLGERTALPKGKWTGAAKALYTAKFNPHEQGLRPLDTPEGPSEYIQLRGIAMLASKEGKGAPRRWLSFDVDDSFTFFERRSFDVEVEFLDAGEGAFSLEYDAWDRALEPAVRSVKSAGERRFTATGEWRTETFSLTDPRFGNLQPGGGDFRLATEKRGIAVRRVSVTPR